MTDSEDEGSVDDECPINEEWLEDVLGCYHRQRLAQQLCVKVGDFSVRPGCASNECVLSDIVAVAVDYKLLLAVERGREAEETAHSLALVVKLLPTDPFSRVFVTEAQFDLREISFYTVVVPELERLAGPLEGALPIPRCYYARYRPATDVSPPESLLVLDNLKAQGYRSQPFALGLTLAQARAALDALARLHALSLLLKLRDADARPLSERFPFLFAAERASESYQELVERGMPLVDDFLRRQPGMEGVARALARLRPLTRDLMTRLLAPTGSLALITHTDFWCNNLLFKRRDAEEEECAVLDWQMATYSRPTNDVALLLLSSLPTQLRRDHETELVDTYWRTFTSTTSRLGVDVEVEHGYDRRQLDEDLVSSKLLAILLCIGSVEVAIGDPLTEQRLVDVLTDLHRDGALDVPEAAGPPSPPGHEPDA